MDELLKEVRIVKSDPNALLLFSVLLTKWSKTVSKSQMLLSIKSGSKISFF